MPTVSRTLDEVKTERLTAEMRTVFNRRASSYHMIAWKKDAKSVYGDEMLNLADGVIAIWKENRSLSIVCAKFQT